MESKLIVWDLDLTLVDSSHRMRFDKNGAFDLEFWINNATKENIFKDKLLPLYFKYEEFKAKGFKQALITARSLKEADVDYLYFNKLSFNAGIYHREKSLVSDKELKEKYTDILINELGYKPYMAFDDKSENLAVFAKYGFFTFNSKYFY